MITRPTRRSAFTLVELLIVITVIGILVGLLIGAVVPAFKRANEFAIQTEMTQLGRSIENFKTQYGFYPPSFKNIGSAPDLLPYINRIAPNHSEGNGLPGSLLYDWWQNCGSQIGSDGSDLVFWLSGLAKNRQFPVTGGRGFIADQDARGVVTQDQGWLAFNGSGFASLPPMDSSLYERELFYDFNSNQLVQLSDPRTQVRAYFQSKGKPSPFLYLDNANYEPTSGNFDGAYAYADANGNIYYYNENSFQLITAGMDGDLGNVSAPNYVRDVGPLGVDNLANFAEGRLERILLGTTN